MWTILGAVLLAACQNNSPAPVPTGLTSSANGWSAYYGPGVVLQPVTGGLVQFAIPANNPSACPNSNSDTLCPGVHYIETAASGLALGKTISMTGSVVTSADAVFNHYTATNNTPAGSPSACRIWFQEAGDNLTGTGAYAYYRWWANDPASVVLQNGTFSISAVLSPGAGDGWTSVMGEQASASAAATAGFQQAIANAAMMGFTCGGGYFYGHGVNMSAGSATFILNSYTVN